MAIHYYDDFLRIIKSSNQDVIGAGLTADTELFFNVLAGNHYVIKLNLITSSSNLTADTAFRFQVDSGTITGKGSYIGTGNTGVLSNSLISANAVATTNTIVCGGQVASLDDLIYCRIHFGFTPTTNTIFRFVFGNNTITAGAISRVWKGTELWYKHLES